MKQCSAIQIVNSMVTVNKWHVFYLDLHTKVGWERIHRFPCPVLKRVRRCFLLFIDFIVSPFILGPFPADFQTWNFDDFRDL